LLAGPLGHQASSVNNATPPRRALFGPVMPVIVDNPLIMSQLRVALFTLLA
jgi:hypothetical protein